MKHTNKKGFTIVELVIVIAVIAILAAVLIPTFSNLIKKANISNDVAIAKNLNTAISVAGVLEGVDSFEDAIAAVREQGFLLANLNTKTEACYFVWEAQSKQFLLVDAAQGFKVLYSANKDYAPIGDTWNIITSDLEKAAEIEALELGIVVRRTVRATADMNNLINSGENVLVYVDESVQLGDESFVNLNKEGAVVTIDFGNATLQGGSANADLAAFPINVVAGNMTIKNGTISAASSFIDADGIERDGALSVVGGVLTTEGTKFEFADTASILTSFENGAVGTFKNVTFNVPNSNTAVGAYAGSQVTLENCDMNVDFIGVFSSGAESKITINGGTYYAAQTNLLTVYGGTVVVENGTFSSGNAAKTLKFYNVGGQIVIKGGTFNGVAFENLNEANIRGMCNLSECSKGVDVVFANGAWTITVK